MNSQTSPPLRRVFYNTTLTKEWNTTMEEIKEIPVKAVTTSDIHILATLALQEGFEPVRNETGEIIGAKF